MSGIICLTPLLSRFLRFALVPIWNFLGLDAGLLAGILAIDMGGYQLAGELSASQEMVRYAGLVIAATLGCTITFTIPVGMGMLKSGDRLFFSRGMLIRKMADIAKRHNLILIVDNTFMSPYFQNPLDLGADVVIHSGTQYLSGHNDTLAGFIVTNREDIQEKLRFLIKTTGAGLAPFDCWLVLRGMKTLGIRMERSQENAEQIAEWLQKQKAVTKVIYPGLPDHPGHEIMKKQARGFGAMLTIQLESKEFALAILEKVRMIRFAESLGGVETLVTYPTTQTHADVPKEIRERNGITESTLRFSVGIESIEDLIDELEKVFAEIEEEKNDGKKS